MKQFNFENISFIIHVRVDIPERLANLTTVMDYYHTMCDNCEFIIVNDDKQPDKQLRPLYERYGSTDKFLFLENDDIYRRPLAFNKGFNNSTRQLMIAGDTDVIIHPRHILKAEHFILSGEHNHVYPYNGLFVHVKEHIRDQFKQEFNFDILNKLKPIQENRYPYYENDDILVAHPESKGGCIMYESEMYNSINGYNPNFRGWGFEDDEINHRIYLAGYKTTRVQDDDAVAWHLPHPNTVRDEHPYYNDNKKIADYIGQIKDEKTLDEYINSWSL